MDAASSGGTGGGKWRAFEILAVKIGSTIAGGGTIKKIFADIHYKRVTRQNEYVDNMYTRKWNPAQYTMFASREGFPVTIIEEDVHSSGQTWDGVDFSDLSRFEVRESFVESALEWKRKLHLKDRVCDLILYEEGEKAKMVEARQAVERAVQEAEQAKHGPPRQEIVMCDQEVVTFNREQAVSQQPKGTSSDQEQVTLDQQDTLKGQFDQFTPTYGLPSVARKGLSKSNARKYGRRGGYNPAVESNKMVKGLQGVIEEDAKMTENGYNPYPSTPSNANNEYVDGLSSRPTARLYRYKANQPVSPIWFYLFSAIVVFGGTALLKYVQSTRFKGAAKKDTPQVGNAQGWSLSIQRGQGPSDCKQKLSDEDKPSTRVSPDFLLETCQAYNKRTITKKTATHILTTYFSLSEGEALDLLS